MTTSKYYELFHKSPRTHESEMMRRDLILGYFLTISNGEIRTKLKPIWGIIKEYMFNSISSKLFKKWSKRGYYGSDGGFCYNLEITQDLKYSLYWIDTEYCRIDFEYNLKGNCHVIDHNTLQLLFTPNPFKDPSALSWEEKAIYPNNIERNKEYEYCVAQLKYDHDCCVYNPRTGKVWSLLFPLK